MGTANQHVNLCHILENLFLLSKLIDIGLQSFCM